MEVKLKRKIFVGDIHGCYAEFKKLLKKVNYDADCDRLISVGDIVNKGPQSAAVLDYFIKNKIEVVKGNHEDWLFRALSGESPMYKEGEQIVQESAYSKEEILHWLKNLPCYIKGEDFVAVHAGFSPYCKLKENNERDLFTVRYVDKETQELFAKDNGEHKLSPWYEEFTYQKPGKREIIHGHWAKKKICEYGRVIGLDTGCVYGGHLSAYIFPSKRIVQVPSEQRKQYDY
ncbi:putative bis(5'-nucleosyl)-tetraphosphatase, symmetrical [Lentisphaera araneosa HTCC2155]|uniref:Putative bis(5'-nucleosyl)-tetraphosphatase, symmetrical n=1 Tax=Lentisphaera araneosa HTCC2155 TaxID=313628 RepID=A6DHD6_9BACT|nr:putative bis(5'-nucleosyl)-tetraphosphatase, symmetrical [Lentisphaera araneosa HTCC2155]